MIAAFTWAYLAGEYLDKYINPIQIKKHGKKAKNLFNNGLTHIATVLLKACFQNDIGIFNFLSCTYLNRLPELMITEHQFAQIVGRAKMYHQLPYREKIQLPQFPLSDSQVTQVVKDYYDDQFFSKNDLGNINLYLGSAEGRSHSGFFIGSFPTLSRVPALSSDSA